MCRSNTTHTHKVQIKTVEEAVGVDKKGMGYNGDNRKSLDSKISSTHNQICSLMVLSHGALISTYCMLPQRKPLFVLLYGLILPIYNSRETVVPPPTPCRNANLPEDFGQESSGPANKLHTTDRVDPSTSQYKSSLYGRYN